jgi:LysM repeat protein
MQENMILMLTDTTTLTYTTTIATPAPTTVATPVPVVPTVIAKVTVVSIPTVAVKTRKYFVESGDTLLSIANKFKVTVQQIEDVNPYLQNPDNLIVGQELDIP